MSLRGLGCPTVNTKTREYLNTREFLCEIVNGLLLEFVKGNSSQLEVVAHNRVCIFTPIFGIFVVFNTF